VNRVRVDHTKRANHLQDGESSIVLIGNQSKLLVHPVDRSVGYVDAVQESEEEQQTEDGNDVDVNLPDQRRLVDAWVYLLNGDLSIAELGAMSIS